MIQSKLCSIAINDKKTGDKLANYWKLVRVVNNMAENAYKPRPPPPLLKPPRPPRGEKPK